MEKTAAGPVKSSSSKGEAVRKAMTRSGLGIITLSMAENVSDVPILPPRGSRAHLDSLGSGQRAEGNGISQRVEWRNTVFPIRRSFPGKNVDGARLQGA